jgi:hypothetical protein
MPKTIFGKLEDLFTYDKIKKIVDDLVSHQVADEAQEFSNKLEKALEESDLKDTNVEMYAKYEKLLARIELTALPCFPPQKAFDVLRKYTAEGLADSDIDLKVNLRRKLIEEPEPFRDDMKKDIRRALRESVSALGTNPIKVGTDETPKRPTVGNWIRDYDHFLGMEKHTKVERGQYLFQNPNTRGLTSQEKKKLDQLFELYEKLKWSTYELGAFDNPSLEIFGPLVGGRVERSEPRPLGKLRERRRPSIPTGILPKVAIPRSPVAPREVASTVPERKERPTEAKSAAPSVTMPKPARPDEMIVDLREKKRAQFPASSRVERLAVKPIPADVLAKLSSPEGLSQLTPQDFRNLGPDPRASAKFLFSKIKKLAISSSIDRIACKDNLRKSELYRTYLSLGKESLDLKKSIREISEVRKREGRTSLTEEEYRVIGEVGKAV